MTRISYRIWLFLSSITPFIALIICTAMTRNLKASLPLSDPTANFLVNDLKIVGPATPGLNILRTPNFHHDFGEFFVECIPLALVLYMESYAVARRIASANNELYLLNASQVRGTRDHCACACPSPARPAAPAPAPHPRAPAPAPHPHAPLPPRSSSPTAWPTCSPACPRASPCPAASRAPRSTTCRAPGTRAPG